MAERGSRPTGGIVVTFATRAPVQLWPGDGEFTFGRGSDRTLRFAHDSAGGMPDLDVSRRVGTLWWNRGLWWLRNDSTTRPFDIIPQPGVSIALSPRSSSPWAVSPPGVRIRVPGPFGPYVLTLTVDSIEERPLDEDHSGNDAPTDITPQLTPRAQLILAAKFLALPAAGDAVGDREAADYATAALGERDREVTPKAVEDCVRKWRAYLQERGEVDIEGQRNINNLGRKLLAWGFLRQEDRALLRSDPSRA